MRSVTGPAVALTLALASCFSCSGQESGTIPDGVFYWERGPEGYVIVDWFPDEDCSVSVSQRANLSDPGGIRANCTDAELAEGRRLLGTEAWKTYESANIPSIPPEMTNAGGSDGDGGPLEGLPPSGNLQVGSIQMFNMLIEEGEVQKTFWADDLGPEEAKLVAYFRALHEKYGDFE